MTIFHSDPKRLAMIGKVFEWLGLTVAASCWFAWSFLRQRLASGAALAAPANQRSHQIVENGRSFYVTAADAQLHWLGKVGFFGSLAVALIGFVLVRRANLNRK
jgi:hypothetical protein